MGTNKLFLVKCKGMQHGLTGPAYGVAYVIAKGPTEAYKKVRERLNTRDLGFSKEREMDSIVLMAEDAEYPDCGYILYT